MLSLCQKVIRPRTIMRFTSNTCKNGSKMLTKVNKRIHVTNISNLTKLILDSTEVTSPHFDKGNDTDTEFTNNLNYSCLFI